MGRALYSQAYQATPAVRVEPELPPSPYEKWSVWNKFDPDSDEFFVDAEYEAFLDPSNFAGPQETQAGLPELLDGDGSISSGSEESDQDPNSPMAVGPDDPARMIETTYGWTTSRDPSGAWTIVERPLPVDDHVDSVPRPHTPPAPVLSSAVRATAFASTADSENATVLPSTPPRGNALSRVASTTAMDSPYTPDASDSPRFSTFASPSPLPAVSPRIYHWNRIPAAAPSSPTPTRESTGPLTNPNARMSHARITPVRLRVQSFAF